MKKIKTTSHTSSRIDNSLITLLYDCVLDPSRFVDFMEQLCTTINAHSGTLAISNTETQEIRGGWSWNINFDYLQLYVTENLGAQDKLLHKALSSPTGKFYCTNRDIENFKDYYNNSDVYQKWGIPLGIYDSTMSLIHRKGNWITFLAIQRTKEQGGYSDDDCAILESLLPHLKRVMLLLEQISHLEKIKDASKTILDTIKIPTVIFDNNGEVLSTNNKADNVFNSNHEISIDDNKIKLKDKQEERELTYKIIEAINTSAGKLNIDFGILTTKGKDQSITFIISPIRENIGNHITEKNNCGAIVFIHSNKNTQHEIPECVSNEFGLTRAEKSICEEIINGKTIDEISTNKHKGKETLKSHLKNIFAKTNSHSQAQLMYTILSNPHYLTGQ